MKKYFLTTLSLLILNMGHALAINVGDEVELTSASVTAITCADQVSKSGKLEMLATCPYEEARKGYAVFDVPEKQPYIVSEKNIFLFELEKAYGGGSIDLAGTVVEKRKGIPVIEVTEYTVRAKPKAGGFKGCL